MPRVPHCLALCGRDRDLLTTLCSRLRILSLPQIAAGWWSTTARSPENARRRLAQLVEGRWLLKLSLLAAPLPAIDRPIVTWQPGSSEPGFGQAAWQLQSRWRQPVRNTLVFLATRQAVCRFGGRAAGRIKNIFQTTHDLGVAQMFLVLRQQRPHLVPLWIGEDRLAPYRRRQKLPDAVLADAADGPPRLVLEFGGAYDKRRLLAFHHDCARRGLPYEVW